MKIKSSIALITTIMVLVGSFNSFASESSLLNDKSNNNNLDLYDSSCVEGAKFDLQSNNVYELDNFEIDSRSKYALYNNQMIEDDGSVSLILYYTAPYNYYLQNPEDFNFKIKDIKFPKDYDSNNNNTTNKKLQDIINERFNSSCIAYLKDLDYTIDVPLNNN